MKYFKSPGKSSCFIDFSDKPGPGSLRDISKFPGGLGHADLAVLKTELGNLTPVLKEKGITNIWTHMNEEIEKTPGGLNVYL